MSRITLCIAIALVLAVSGGPTAWADAEAGQGFINVAASYIDDDPDRGVNDEVSGGQIGIGAALNEKWDLELLLQQAGMHGPASQDQFGAGIDLRRVFNRSGRFSPYLFGGIGLLDVEPDIGSDDSGGMYAAGLGFFADVFGNSDVALRAEYRFRKDDAIGSGLSDNIFSLGLQFPFGSVRQPISDSDGDGVPDPGDRCPGTRAGAEVDANGCELDGDGDGVVDADDQCPGTPRGAAVDSRGCELDDDRDGVANSLDNCPNTPRGVPVDAQGCELDSDNDGIRDSIDECPDTAAGVRVDNRGCEIRDAIRLPSVQFETNSDRLVAGAETSLDDAVLTLQRYPELLIEVEGHTDSDGAAEYNEGLSARRANTVLDYLVNAGIDSSRLEARGYGEARPIADNGTADGKRQNRRVVLRILNE